jgi:hypothetical protein
MQRVLVGLFKKPEYTLNAEFDVEQEYGMAA